MHYVCIYTYVCMHYVCVYICIYVLCMCMYACMYACFLPAVLVKYCDVPITANSVYPTVSLIDKIMYKSLHLCFEQYEVDHMRNKTVRLKSAY
jgi:hypothetical protein